VLTPICPHSLNQRPLVLPQQTEVEIRLKLAAATESATLTVDGQEGLALAGGDRVVSKRSLKDRKSVV